MCDRWDLHYFEMNRWVFKGESNSGPVEVWIAVVSIKHTMNVILKPLSIILSSSFDRRIFVKVVIKFLAAQVRGIL